MRKNRKHKERQKKKTLREKKGENMFDLAKVKIQRRKGGRNGKHLTGLK